MFIYFVFRHQIEWHVEQLSLRVSSSSSEPLNQVSGASGSNCFCLFYSFSFSPDTRWESPPAHLLTCSPVQLFTCSPDTHPFTCSPVHLTLTCLPDTCSPVVFTGKNLSRCETMSLSLCFRDASMEYVWPLTSDLCEMIWLADENISGQSQRTSCWRVWQQQQLLIFDQVIVRSEMFPVVTWWLWR